MQLTNGQLQNFVGRIKLRRTDKAKYHNQIEHLIKQLRAHIAAQPRLKITRVLRTGSWKKGTSLRPRAGRALDIDLVFFLDVAQATPDDIGTLHDLLLDFLLSAYLNKSADDFKAQNKTVGLVFRGSGLEADLVPVVALDEPHGYVWQPERGGGGVFTTSVDGQLAFVQALKAADPNFTSIVRMVKCWRNYQELGLSSFAIELLQAHLQVTRGACASIEDGVIRFFECLSDGADLCVGFDGAINTLPYGARMHLADPTNNANNALARMTPHEWAEAVGRAEEAFDALNHAQSISAMGRTLDAWRAVFGPAFAITPEA